jgi:hypothetical protein
MPLLAYCIAESGHKIETPHGVQDAIVNTVTECGLTGFVSNYQPLNGHNQIRSAALNFNQVLQQLLQQIAIIPFRFPTLFADESEMSDFLKEHAEEYRKALLRLRDVVQMEVSLSFDQPITTSQASGTEYLRARQSKRHKLAEGAHAIRTNLDRLIKDWREHESSGGMRCYMLILRNDVNAVFQHLKGSSIASGLHARVTGPWPATEFVSANPETRASETFKITSP